MRLASALAKVLVALRRTHAISSSRDDLGTRSGAAAESATNVERQAKAREDGTDDHPNKRSKLGSLCGRAGRAQSPRGAAASTTVAVAPFTRIPSRKCGIIADYTNLYTLSDIN